MRTLHALATLLLLTGIGFFLFDLIIQIATHGISNMKILSIEALWTDLSKDSLENAKSMAETVFPSNEVNLVLHMPAALVLLVLSGIFYLPLRILKLMGAGKKEEDWRGQ